MTKRVIEDRIFDEMNTKKVFLLIGARQVGKTTIMRSIRDRLKKQGEQTFFLNLDNPAYVKMLDDDIESIFQIIGKTAGKKYVFVDEIQYLKDPTRFLKYFYDEYSDDIKLIVSGSSSFYIDKKFRDSLVGRKKIFYINTLDFVEYLIFKGREDLVKYLNGEPIPLLDMLRNNDLISGFI